MPAKKRSEPPTALSVGGLTLNVETRQVADGRNAHRLTPKQCRLLATFMQNPNRTLTRAELMRQVWDTDFTGDTRTLDVHVCWLRRKIEDEPHHPTRLRTVRGVGYRFVT